MQHVDAIETKDLTQKCEFFSKLAQTIPQFPRVSSNKSLNLNSSIVLSFLFLIENAVSG